MRKITLALAIILFLVTPNTGGAAGGITNPSADAQLTYTPAQTITLPYTFAPYSITSTTTADLDVSLGDVGFINQVGSIALTLFSILDEFRILGIFMVILLAVGAMFWLWVTVTETPAKVSLNVFDAAEVGADMHSAHLDAQQRGAERRDRLSGDSSYTDDINRRRGRLTTFRKVSRSVKRGYRSFK
jgi:hypothetical protein